MLFDANGISEVLESQLAGKCASPACASIDNLENRRARLKVEEMLEHHGSGLGFRATFVCTSFMVCPQEIHVESVSITTASVASTLS